MRLNSFTNYFAFVCVGPHLSISLTHTACMIHACTVCTQTHTDTHTTVKIINVSVHVILIEYSASLQPAMLWCVLQAVLQFPRRLRQAAAGVLPERGAGHPALLPLAPRRCRRRRAPRHAAARRPRHPRPRPVRAGSRRRAVAGGGVSAGGVSAGTPAPPLVLPVRRPRADRRRQRAAQPDDVGQPDATDAAVGDHARRVVRRPRPPAAAVGAGRAQRTHGGGGAPRGAASGVTDVTKLRRCVHRTSRAVISPGIPYLYCYIPCAHFCYKYSI